MDWMHSARCSRHARFGYYGLALAYEKEGNRSAASQAHAEFLDSWKYTDEDLEMVRAARAARLRPNYAGSQLGLGEMPLGARCR